ncbi:MAG TPA: class II aldolase/adducin family protein [Firmicutes bacterium]|nr:class II aldolase/adducin family protein [Bacillota bacterium]
MVSGSQEGIVKAVRSELWKYGRKIIESGLVVGPGGNISARAGNVMYISPSGYAFDDVEPEDYVGVDISSGDLVDVNENKKPSSEVLMHLACYRARQDVGAVVHIHPAYGIAVASTIGRLEAMFPDFAAYVGKVGMLGYVVPSSAELAEAVERKIVDYNAILMSNHGAVTVGANLKEAFYRAVILEEGAKIFVLSKILGEPRVFSEEDVEEIRNLGAEKYRTQLLKQSRQA